MNYVILQYIFMVYVCNVKTSANTNIDIDNFIKRLMSSQKFEALTDMVAEKAVNKIKGIDKPEIRLQGLERFFTVNNGSQDKENSKENFEKETTTYTDFRIEAPPLPILGKINTEALMKTEAIAQSANLRLKYKYLTRNAKKSDVQGPVLINYETTEEPSKQTSMPEVNNLQQQQASNTESPNIGDDVISNRYENIDEAHDGEIVLRSHDIHIDLDHRTEKTVLNSAVSPNINDDKINAEGNGAPTKIQSSTEDDLKELEMKLNKEEDEDLNEGQGESEKSERSEEQGEDDEGPMFRANDDNKVPDVEDNKVTSDYQGNPDESQEKTPSTKKPVIRKEGNKIYTFAEGSDYEEYHEQYAKMEKEKTSVFPIL